MISWYVCLALATGTAAAEPTLRQEVRETATVSWGFTILRPFRLYDAHQGRAPGPYIPAGFLQAVWAEPVGRVVGIADGEGGVLVNGVTVWPGKTQGVR